MTFWYFSLDTNFRALGSTLGDGDSLFKTARRGRAFLVFITHDVGIKQDAPTS